MSSKSPDPPRSLRIRNYPRTLFLGLGRFL